MRKHEGRDELFYDLVLARRFPRTSITTTYTVKRTDKIIAFNHSSAFTLTLNDAEADAGAHFILVDESGDMSKTVTLNPEGATTINGAATKALEDADYGVWIVWSDGSKWFVDTKVVTTADISVRVRSDSIQSIPNATWTPINFDVEDYDTDGMHDNTTNNTRLTCKTAGKFWIHAIGYFARSSFGYRQAGIVVSDVGFIAFDTRSITGADTEQVVSCGCYYDLAVNDYVEFRVYQESGGSLNSKIFALAVPLFEMARILA